MPVHITPVDDIDPAMLRHSFSYSPKTGVLRWRFSDSHRIKPGDVAGHVAVPLREGGRIVVWYMGRKIRAHRIIWAYMTGKWPTCQIDHVNRNPGDNRWINLRESSQTQNMWNTKTPTTNKSGLRGAFFCKCAGRWSAQIRANGKKKYLGLFNTKEEAHEAYKTASLALHGAFSHYILPSDEKR